MTCRTPTQLSRISDLMFPVCLPQCTATTPMRVQYPVETGSNHSMHTPSVHKAVILMFCLPSGREQLSFYAVFDGHGGVKASQYAAANIHKQLASIFPKGQSHLCLSASLCINSKCDLQEILRRLSQKSRGSLSNPTRRQTRSS